MIDVAIIVFSVLSLLVLHNEGAKTSGPSVLQRQLELSHYSAQIRPGSGGPPITVNVGLFITSIHSLSEISMDYGATMYLIMEWNDVRVRFNRSDPIDLRSGSKLQSMIWTPDLYFVNTKDGDLHHVTETNKQMRIHPDGHVIYDIRVSLVLICHMHLHRFPMDKQSCAIEIESFGYSTRDVQLDWGLNFTAIIPSDVALSGFIIKPPNVRKETQLYPMGFYDRLVCEFLLDRELIFYIMENYVPSCLLVILSWVSFWLSVEATPARASLGITTVLTLTTLSSTARTQLPKVSYTKAIDVWMLVCSVFVFAALVEFAVASYANLTDSDDSCEESKECFDQPGQGVPYACESCAEYRQPFLRNPKGATITKTVVKPPRTIDEYSRVLFPTVFIIFNIGYWPYYLSGYY